MKRTRLLPISPILCGLLASCSGGSDGGSQSGPAPVVTPAPTPLPSTTPVAYMTASDFTYDRSFTGIGMRITIDRRGTTPASDFQFDPEGTAVGFDFIAATRSYRARYNNDTITAATQPVADGPSGGSVVGTYDVFSGPDSGLIRSPLPIDPSTRSTYVGYLRWSDDNGAGTPTAATLFTSRYILFGARTVASDLPTTGAPTFAGQSIITGPSGGSGFTTSITVNYAARTVSGTTLFAPSSTGGTGSSTRPSPTPEQITLSGTLDPATGRITGVATHVLTGEAGKFEGALYGPRGLEVGLVFAIKSTNNSSYYGVAGGRS